MTKPVTNLNVLFIDDEVDNLSAFVFNCEEFWNAHTVKNPDEITSGNYSLANHDAIIVDLVYDYPEDLTPDLKVDPGRGLKVLEWLKENHPQIPTMVLSAFLTDDLRKHIKDKYPKVLCMDKPLDFSKAEFREMMENFIKDYQTK